MACLKDIYKCCITEFLYSTYSGLRCTFYWMKATQGCIIYLSTEYTASTGQLKYTYGLNYHISSWCLNGFMHNPEVMKRTSLTFNYIQNVLLCVVCLLNKYSIARMRIM
ncbi:hypothetical protein XELAEV_18007974mg [Xenopus laevis]|uniref:Uncharacterized protein n=1 Tax=Xenopus laevis TaxID=8355 RepID=A0A974I4Y8_XENLA|nr:hypothetical protein XELAEV_18007974mg [Xenopus laevis]